MLTATVSFLYFLLSYTCRLWHWTHFTFFRNGMNNKRQKLSVSFCVSLSLSLLSVFICRTENSTSRRSRCFIFFVDVFFLAIFVKTERRELLVLRTILSVIHSESKGIGHTFDNNAMINMINIMMYQQSLMSEACYGMGFARIVQTNLIAVPKVWSMKTERKTPNGGQIVSLWT